MWRHDGVLGAGTRHLGPRQALQLDLRGGELRVLLGSVWLTRSCDPTDYFLARGDCYSVGRGERAVIEPTRAGEPSLVHWEPVHPRWLRWLDRTLRPPVSARRGLPSA
jgi:hypothetical protein